jgi:hypothetical protein
VGKYDPLSLFLQSFNKVSLDLRFSDLETILGERLPHSARCHRAWWSNETSGTHVQARSWLQADWKVKSVDMSFEMVCFTRGT